MISRLPFGPIAALPSAPEPALIWAASAAAIAAAPRRSGTPRACCRRCGRPGDGREPAARRAREAGEISARPGQLRGRRPGGAVVVRRVQDETQVVRELLDLVVQLRQEQVAGLEQALQPAAAQPAHDQLRCIGRGVVLRLGREAGAHAARDQRSAVRSIGWPEAGIDLVLAEDRDATEVVACTKPWPPGCTRRPGAARRAGSRRPQCRARSGCPPGRRS